MAESVIKPWEGCFFHVVSDLLPEPELTLARAAVFDYRFWRRGAYYEWLVAAGAALRPRSILEIGVRMGCGGAALAFGAAQAGVKVERYFGVDNLCAPNADMGTAVKILGRWVGGVKIQRANLHDMNSVDGEWDLAYLDAEHTDVGTRKQIQLAAPCARVILVDDCLDPVVNSPVLVSTQPGGLLAGWSREWLPSITGITLLRRP